MVIGSIEEVEEVEEEAEEEAAFQEETQEEIKEEIREDMEIEGKIFQEGTREDIETTEVS